MIQSPYYLFSSDSQDFWCLTLRPNWKSTGESLSYKLGTRSQRLIWVIER